MGNVCPSDCLFDCCTYNGICAANFNNCYYFYYDWTWVYWTAGVVFVLLVVFTIFGIICRRRRIQRAQQTLIIQTGQGSYLNSNYQNGQYAYQQGFGQNESNRNMTQAQYQMGQPVFLSDGQYSSNQNYVNNQGNADYGPNQGYNNDIYRENNQNINQGFVVQASRPVHPQYNNYKQS